MRAKDDGAQGHRLPGVYEFLLGLVRNNVDPRLHYGKSPEEANLVNLFGPRARPARLARLERGEPTLVPRWWLGTNYFPRASNCEDFHDRTIRGWEIRADDTVMPVGHDDPRWSGPGNRL